MNRNILPFQNVQCMSSQDRAVISSLSIFYFIYLYIYKGFYLFYLRERERAQAGGGGRGRNRLPAEQGVPLRTWPQNSGIPEPWDHDLNQRQTFNWLESPRCHSSIWDLLGMLYIFLPSPLIHIFFKKYIYVIVYSALSIDISVEITQGSQELLMFK